MLLFGPQKINYIIVMRGSKDQSIRHMRRDVSPSARGKQPNMATRSSTESDQAPIGFKCIPNVLVSPMDLHVNRRFLDTHMHRCTVLAVENSSRDVGVEIML